MAAPVQDIRIWDIQDRTNRSSATRPWVLRWKVDGAERSRSFPTKGEADHVRSRLIVARREGERFDRATGLPEAWQTKAGDRRLDQWVRSWLEEQWPEWQPRTRRSAIEALSRFIPAVRDAEAPAPPPTLRRHLERSLVPGEATAPTDRHERWLRQWSPPITQLDREMMARAEQRLAVGLNGQRLAPSVVSRFRKVAHASIVRAVDLGVLERDPWPPPPRGRRTRKINRVRRAIDVRILPDPSTMAQVIASMRTHQPGSATYQAMTAVAYYAGLRPSEVVMLRPRALVLPRVGWGRINVVEADVGWDEPGEPKTGNRAVPVPPVLVAVLRTWVAERNIGSDDLLFRTRGDKRPTPSNWARSLQRALGKLGHQSMRVYDCRHAAATTWLRAGVPLGVVAMRLGHSVETLVSTYVGALEGDDALANERIEAALASTAAGASGPVGDEDAGTGAAA